MLTIRLQRKGRRNQPFFKIVVTEEKKSSTGGRFVEEIGFYNPLTKEKSINGERAKYWMSVGAQPSDTMHNMLISENVIEGTKRPQHKKSKKKQPDTPAQASAPEGEAGAEIKPAEEPKAEEPAAQIDKAPEAETAAEEPAREDKPAEPKQKEEVVKVEQPKEENKEEPTAEQPSEEPKQEEEEEKKEPPQTS